MEARAFEELVVRHQGIVCGVAYAILRDRARSEEVAQEAFLVAWQKQIDAPAWICAVARNLARNAARRRREHTMETEPIATTPDARDELIAREDAARANAALATLPPPLREAIVVYYHGDESMAAVAAALDISHAAAKQRVHRGREQLRELLAPVENTLRRARPGAAFTGACIAAWLARGGEAEAATTGTGAATAGALAASGTGATATLATAAAWILALAGGIATGVAVDTPRSGAYDRVLGAAVGAPPTERVHSAPPPSPSLPVLSATTSSTAADALGPHTPFSMRSEGGTLRPVVAFMEAYINMPLRVADGFDFRVRVDSDEVPLIEVLDDIIRQANAKRTEIAAVRIVQQGGSTDAASLGGDLVTLHLYDEPMFEVMRMLEPKLHLPIFRDVSPHQMPGPSSEGDELFFRKMDGSSDREIVPHVTIDLVNVTAGQALAQILEQTGLGYVRTTGYLIEPR